MLRARYERLSSETHFNWASSLLLKFSETRQTEYCKTYNDPKKKPKLIKREKILTNVSSLLQVRKLSVDNVWLSFNGSTGRAPV